MTAPNGTPLLWDALAAFACEVDDIVERNTHAIVVGRVKHAAAASTAARSLLARRLRSAGLERRRVARVQAFRRKARDAGTTCGSSRGAPGAWNPSDARGLDDGAVAVVGPRDASFRRQNRASPRTHRRMPEIQEPGRADRHSDARRSTFKGPSAIIWALAHLRSGNALRIRAASAAVCNRISGTAVIPESRLTHRTDSEQIREGHPSWVTTEQSGATSIPMHSGSARASPWQKRCY